MLRTTALMILTLAIALLALVIAMATLIAPAYVWLHLDREQLAGFGLILIYWCTLVLAHYYYETRVTRARVEAEISVARLRAAAFLDARDERRDVARSNGDVQAHGGSRGGSRRAGVAAGATATAVVTEPAAQVTGSLDGPADGTGEADDSVLRILAEAQRLLDARCGRGRHAGRGVMTFLGWESAPELSALQLVNAADVIAWDRVTDETAVSARIVRAQSQIGELVPAQQKLWTSQFAAFWRSDGRPTPLDVAVPRRRGDTHDGSPENDRALTLWRSRLCAFLFDLYESRQVRNARLASIQQKASWGVLITLWVLVALVVAGDGRILLAGAIGGLLSRMTRFTGVRWLTTDFGLGWAQLYLAPPVGALAAWGGIHALLFVQRFGTVDAHNALQAAQAQATGPNAAAVLGLAFALGFSERLFDKLLRGAADTIAPPAEAPQHATVPAGVPAP